MNNPEPQASFQVDQLRVEVHRDRASMGLAAAIHVAEVLRRRLLGGKLVSVVFASAPSQNEFLAELSQLCGVDWSRVIAFHMDEYVGLPSEAPQSFGRFLQDRLFSRVKPGIVHFLDGTCADLAREIARYSSLLKTHAPDIVCGGIGENGHLAFNDPRNADFDDPFQVKIVQLALRSRQQQVNDGCFAHLEDVPKRALTLTIPSLLSASSFSCVVPGTSKAKAVKRMLTGPISTACPASALRRHPQAILYLDPGSASMVQAMGTRGDE